MRKPLKVDFYKGGKPVHFKNPTRVYRNKQEIIPVHEWQCGDCGRYHYTPTSAIKPTQCPFSSCHSTKLLNTDDKYVCETKKT